MTEISAEQAYRALQRRAREERRGTEELLIFYAHEGFLRRLSVIDVLDGVGATRGTLDARQFVTIVEHVARADMQRRGA